MPDTEERIDAELEARPRGAKRQLHVEVACLACGRGTEYVVDDLAHLPPTPRPCSFCAGSVIAAGVEVRWIYPHGHLDLTDDAPRRGRPPGKQHVC